MIQTKVTEAQIYRSRATVYRKGEAQLEKGKNRLLIAGLTNSAFTDTMHLKFPSYVKASTIRVMEGRDSTESDEITRRIRRLERKKTALETQAEMWKTNAGFNTLKDLTLKDMETYINSYPERVETIEDRIQEILAEKKKLEEELNKTVSDERKPLVSVEIYSEKAGPCPFEMSYLDSHAGWSSKYEIHGETDGTEVEFRFGANVYQDTGENWQDITLKLRTGSPARYMAMRQLEPVYLDFVDHTVPEVPHFLKKSRLSDTLDPFEGDWGDLDAGFSADTASLELSDLKLEGAEVNTEETGTEYILPGLYSMNNGRLDGLFVSLNTFTVPAEYRICSVPRLDSVAYLNAEIRMADLPMVMSGEAEVYLNDIYTSVVKMNFDRTDETCSVPLGVLERISVTRSAYKKKASEAMIRNQRSAVYETVLKAASSRDTDTELTLIDQIPVSRDQAIIVELLDCDKAEKNPESGQLKWKLELKPGEMKTVKVSYRISWPKDRELERFI